MANYAVVKNGVVENIVIWDGQTAFSVEGSEIIEATDDTRIGGSWDGDVFTFVQPLPRELTAEEVSRQAKRDSVKSKLEALGLTTEEVQEAFGL